MSLDELHTQIQLQTLGEQLNKRQVNRYQELTPTQVKCIRMNVCITDFADTVTRSLNFPR